MTVLFLDDAGEAGSLLYSDLDRPQVPHCRGEEGEAVPEVVSLLGGHDDGVLEGGEVVGDDQDVLSLPLDDICMEGAMWVVDLSLGFVLDLNHWQLLVDHALIAGVVQPVELGVKVKGVEAALEGSLPRWVVLELMVVQVEEQPPRHAGRHYDPLLDRTWGEEVDLLLDHQ